MNAPVLVRGDAPDDASIIAFNTRAVLGFTLFDLALSGGIALSDRYGCWTAICAAHPVPVARPDRDGAHRLAIDLVQGHAQRLDAACRAVLARAEKVAEHATGDEAHAALAEISDLIAEALAGGAAPS